MFAYASRFSLSNNDYSDVRMLNLRAIWQYLYMQFYESITMPVLNQRALCD